MAHPVSAVSDPTSARLRGHPARWWLLSAGPAVLLGAAIASRHGVSPAAYAPNVVALAMGAGLGWAARRAGMERVAAVAPALTLVGVAATLLGPGLDGVRRWVALGPVRLNSSTMLAPWLIAGLLSSRPGVRWRAVGLLVATQTAHLAQPDAAQASALAAGALPLLVGGALDRRAGAAVAALLAGLAALTWTRPDPLAALDHVERIVALARDLGPLWLTGALLVLLALLAPFAALARTDDVLTRRACAAATAYLLAALGAAWVGHFPVPVLGAGAGPVLGWCALVSVVSLAASRPVE